MIIGIDASRAFIKQRTGIEEYSYQIIKNLVDKLSEHEVVLYIRNSQQSVIISQQFPANWKIKIIKWSYLWTQAGLSLEMLFHPVDVLFIPAHVVPIIHPARNASLFSLALLIQKILKIFKISTFYNQHSDARPHDLHSVSGMAGGSKNTFVVVHGLEYEFCPKAYSFLERIYMRWSIKNSCRWAKKIIAVSENTKRDLMNLYKVPEGKIKVVYEGYENNLSFRVNLPIGEEIEESNSEDLSRSLDYAQDDKNKYLLFIGRIEERKNISGIINAFEILKKKYKIPHKLVLAGKGGYNFEKIKEKIKASPYVSNILLTGFVDENKKNSLLKNADVFLFPTFYEGFGLPLLEAQNAGVPVVASNNSSIPEVTKCHFGLNPESSQKNILDSRLRENDKYSALLVDPKNPSEIAEAVYKIISDENIKKDLIAKGLENIKRFSWEKCAKEIAEVLMNE